MRDKKKYKSKENNNSDLVLFVSLILGMVTSIMGAVMLYRVINPPDVDSSIALIEEETTPQVSKSLAANDFEWVKEKGSDKQVAEYLELLAVMPKDTEIPSMLEFQSKRIEMADELISREPSLEMMEAAVLSKLKAYSIVYGTTVMDNSLRDESLTSIYREYAEPLTQSDNTDISAEAHLALARIYCCEYVIEPDVERIPQIKSAVKTMVTEFPDHLTIAGVSDLLLKVVTKHDQKLGTQLMAIAHDTFSKSDDPTISKIGRDLQDEILLTESPIRLHFKKRTVLTLENQTSLYDDAHQLILDPRLGENGIQMVSRAMNWFEQTGRAEAVSNLAKLILRHLKEKDAKVQAMMETIAIAFIRREQLKGTPFNFNLTRIDGTPLNASYFEGRPCLVAFIRNDKRSQQLVQAILTQRQKFQKNGSRILFVMDLKEDEETIESYRESKLNFVFGKKKNEDGFSVLGIHPITFVPTLSLVDHEGNYFRVNARHEKVQYDIEKLAEKRLND